MKTHGENKRMSALKRFCTDGVDILAIALAVIACSSCDGNQSGTQPVVYDALTGDETEPGIDWIQVDSGSFIFGSDPEYPCRGGAEKQVPVTLTRSFVIASTEVTQAQWEALNLPNPSKNVGADKPVTFINFYEALVWCNKLSLLEGLETCYDLSTCRNEVGTGCGPDDPWEEEGCWDESRVFTCSGEIHKFEDWYTCPGYRLPTTAEWEYAAKANVTETRTYSGDLIGEQIGNCGEQPSLNDIAWYCFNSGDELHPVGQKLPNPWGLYDTLGNVFEWVDYFADGQPLDYDEPDQPQTDPIGPKTGEYKDLRGGYFKDTGCIVNPSWQSTDSPSMRAFYTGFRPVRTIFE